MPKYFPFKICGYYLYFTAHCVVECMHVHASNEELTEPGSAKFFVRSDGSSKLTARGRLKDREITKDNSLPYNLHKVNIKITFQKNFCVAA